MNGKKDSIQCDVVLSAVGVKTNIENIGLEELGIITWSIFTYCSLKRDSPFFTIDSSRASLGSS